MTSTGRNNNDKTNLLYSYEGIPDSPVSDDPYDSASEHADPDEDDGFEESDLDDDYKAGKDDKISRSDIVTFVVLVTVTFISWVAYSLMAPYFPIEAHRRGMSDTQTGVVFALQSLTVFLVSPIVGKFIPYIGAKRTLVIGLLIEASGNVFFGLCEKLESTTSFVVFIHITRIFVGVGIATVTTSTLTINANTFPMHISTTLGILEMATGVGLIIGPIVGGTLYQLGGSSFLLPFVVIGSIDMGSMFLVRVVLPSPNLSSSEPGSVWELLCIPIIWPLVLTAFISSTTVSYLEPVLAVEGSVHLDSAFLVGLLFLIPSSCYGISSVVWGRIADVFNITRPSIVVGLILVGVANFLLGPSPILHFSSTLWLLCVSLAILGLADGVVVVSLLGALYETASSYGLPGDLRTHGVVSGIFNSAYALGTSFGPFIPGGVLYGQYGFPVTTSVIATVNMAMALVVAISSLLETKWRTRCGGKEENVKVLRQIKATNHVPETTPLFQQPKRK